MILHFQLALPCCTANPPDTQARTHACAHTHKIHYCDRYCSRCDGGTEGHTALTRHGTTHGKKKERKESKFRSNEVKKAIRRNRSGNEPVIYAH